MNRMWNMKRLLAAILTLALLAGALPVQALAEQPEAPQPEAPQAEAPQVEASQTLTDTMSDLTEPLTAGQDVKLVTYHEVEFSLPAGEGEEEAEVTQMEESTLVPDGTPISELPQPTRARCLFLGWYYDDELTQIAGEEDLVETDLVLYPRFEVQNGLDGEADHRYIHAENVGPDYQVVVSSFGLTREQAAEYIRVRDYSEGDGDPERKTSRAFTLADAPLPEKPLDLESLELTEEQLEQVRIAIDEVKAGRMDGVALYDALVFLEVPLGASLAILAKYARDDIEEIAQVLDQRDAEEREAALALAKELYPDSEIVFADDLEADEAEEEIENETAYEAESAETARFAVLPEGGAWTAGHDYEIEILDTARLRFIEEGEPAQASVTYSNFNVFIENEDTVRVASGVIFIPIEQIEGVEPGVAPVNISLDENGGARQSTEDGAKVLSYSGDRALAAGDVLAVYDGELLEDGIVDGDVTYVKIAGPLEEGKFAYVTPNYMEVANLPENIPVPDDGSFEDGVIVVDAAAVDFSAPIYEQARLNAKTTVDEGDFLTFYTGVDLAAALEDEALFEGMQSTGMGRVTKVEAANGKLTIAYEPATFEDMDAVANFHMSDVPINVSLSEEESALLAMEIRKQVEESGFAQQAGQYIQALVMDEDLPQHLSDAEYDDVMRHAAFEMEDGQPMTLEEVRLLSGAGQFVSLELDGTPSIEIKSPQHFSGDKGVKVTVGIGCKLTILLNTVNDRRNQVVITGRFTGSQEVAWSYSANFWKEWSWWGPFPYISDVRFQTKFTLKSYTSLGFTARVTLEQELDEEETPWTKLKSAALGLLNNDGADKAHDNALQLLDRMAEAAQSAEQEGQFDEAMASALPDAYAGFISSASDYVKLYQATIFRYSENMGMLGFVQFTISVDFVIRMRMTALLGLGVTYEVQRKFDITMWASKRDWEKDTSYVTDPTFTLGFFAFGLIGVKAGVIAQIRMGFFNTDWDSVGLQAEVGAYVEAYGFFYFVYHRSNKSFQRMQGSLYYETGIYLELNFHVQVGNDWKAKTWNLYNNKWPILNGGAKEYPMDFSVPAGDRRLNVEITGGATSAKVNSDVFGIKTMNLVNGNTSSRSMDSSESYAHQSAISAAAQAYAQAYTDAKYAEAVEFAKKVDKSMRDYFLESAKKLINFSVTATAGASADEKNFFVEIYDVDPATGKPTGTHSFRYDPKDNTVYVEPAADGPAERWGKLVFTYRNNAFGISTVALKRTVNIHWKGEIAEVPVNYITVEDGQNAAQGTTLATETLSFVKGLSTKFTLTREVLNRVPGARLTGVNLIVTRLVMSGYSKVKTGFVMPVFKQVNEVYPQSIKQGTVIDINPKPTENMSLQLIYQYNDVRVNWSLMTPGDDATPFAEAVTTTEKANKPIEQVVPAQLRQIIDGVEGYHVVWYQKQGAVMKRTDAVGPTDTELVGLFVPNDHTVSWVVSESNIQTQTVAYNSLLTPPQVSRTGRTFTRWILDDKTLDPNLRMPDHDLTIKAGWKRNKYKVVWVIDGQVVAYTEVPYDTKLSEIYPEEANREHYTTEWKKKARIDNLSVKGTSYTGRLRSKTTLSKAYEMPAYDLYIEGVWTPNKNKVTWISEGRESLEKTVAYNKALNAPDPGSVEGHTCTGWTVRRKSGTEPFVEGMPMPDEELIIAAVWEPVPCPVYFVTGARVERRTNRVLDQTVQRVLNSIIGVSPALYNLYLRSTSAYRYETEYVLTAGTLEAQVEIPYGTSGRELASYADVSREGHTVTWTQALPYNGALEGKVSGEARPLGSATVPLGGMIVLGDWEANVHTLTWQVEGEEPVLQQVSFGQTLPPPPTVNSREGYTLNPWMIGENMLQDGMTMPDKDLTITADWSLNAHQVLWEIDDALVKEETVSYGAALTPPQPEPVEGHTLTEWRIGDAPLTAQTTMPDEKIIIRAYWKPNRHSVTWTIDGEAVKEETVAYGSALVPPAPTRAGYDLSDWSLEGGEALAADAVMPDNDLTIAAAWIPRQAKADWFLYDANSDQITGLAEAFEAQYGEALSKHVPEAARAELDDARYTCELFTLQGSFTAQQAMAAQSKWAAASLDDEVLPGETTFIIRREPVMADVTWAYDTGDVTQTVWVGDKLAAPTQPDRVGHRFDGWADANGKTWEYPPVGGVRLIPQFTALEYTVTWLNEGATVRTDTLPYGTRLTPPSVSRTGHSFAGWQTDQGLLPADATVPAFNLTATAQWSLNSYTVTWIAGGETVGTTTVAYGASLTPPSVAGRTGHTLSGWTVNGAPLSGVTMPDHDVTATASWSANSYTLTWESEGNVIGSQSVTYGAALNAPQLTRTGYTLKGWTTADGAPLPGAMPAGALRAVAVWQINSYNVTWMLEGMADKTESLEYGAVLVPPEVNKEHYTRSPWMLNGAPLPAGATVPASDIVITASWIANSHTAVWVDDDGRTLETKTIAYGQPIPTGPAIGDVAGHDFLGWSIGGELVTSNTTMPDDDITLRPERKIRSHQLFWVVDGKTVKKESVEYGGRVTPPTQSKKGHTLSDWTVNGSKLTGSFTMPDNSVTAMASWTVNTHTLTWTVDGKTVQSGKVAYGTKLTPPSVTPRDGHELSDWKIGNKKIDKNTTMPDEDTTVKAVWEHNEHVWDTGTVTKEPTCDSEGTFTEKCLYCKETKKTPLPKDPSTHKSTKVKNKKDPTCGEDGYTGDTYCKDCGVVIAEGDSIPMTGQHKWGKEKVATPATCLREGVKTQTCSKCDEVRRVAIPVDPNNHANTATVGAELAGCFEDGYTGDVRCQDCGKVVTPGEAIPAKGEHTWNKGARKQAKTETEAGLVVYTCTRCGQQKEEYEPLTPKLDSLYLRQLRASLAAAGMAVPAPGVVVVRLEDIAQAAKEQGAVMLSQLDPALFLQAFVGVSADAKDRIDIQASYVWVAESAPKAISALRDGDILEVLIVPTDTQRYKSEYATVTLTHAEHQWQYVTMLTTPTCKQPGAAGQACAFCGETRTVTLPVDPENHSGATYVVGKKDATADEAGYTGDTICADCGELLKAGEVIPPTGTTP